MKGYNSVYYRQKYTSIFILKMEQHYKCNQIPSTLFFKFNLHVLCQLVAVFSKWLFSELPFDKEDVGAAFLSLTSLIILFQRRQNFLKSLYNIKPV